MTTNALLPSPETTLVIILGASEYPDIPNFKPTFRSLEKDFSE
jgi:hypothetical protein